MNVFFRNDDRRAYLEVLCESDAARNTGWRSGATSSSCLP